MLVRPFLISRGLTQATSFGQIRERFSAILAGVSLRGIAKYRHEATLPANTANIALSGQKEAGYS
jgi:hypothetical protein